jgi:glycosyltransferase involved in cell wall biosynthesis
MRVCLVGYTFYESSAALLQFAESFARKGDQVDAIVLGRPGKAKRETRGGVNIYRLQTRIVNEQGQLIYLYRTLVFFIRVFLFLSLKQLFRGYDLVHVQNVPNFLVFSAIVPRLLGTPVIQDVYDIVPEFYSSKFTSDRETHTFRVLRAIEKLSAVFSSHVVVPNHVWHERLISRSVSRAKCTVIRYFPDREIFFPRQKTLCDGKFTIIFPGNLNWHQGVDIAVRAFSKVVIEDPEAEFHIYGEGPEKNDLVALTTDLGLTLNVRFHPVVPKNEIVPLMANSDIAVVPVRVGSLFGTDACSVKILEFMALGIPVVASKTKVHGLYYNDSIIQFYANDSVEELAANILELKNDMRLRNQLVSNALEYINSNTWDDEMKKYCAIVESLQGQTPVRSPQTGRPLI